MVPSNGENHRIMNTDWKQKLGGLLEDMPPASSQPENEEPAMSEVKKKPMMTLFYEKRHGKPSTIICGYTESSDESLGLARLLKQRLACGGSERDGEILLQGDVRDKVRTILQAEGYKVKN